MTFLDRLRLAGVAITTAVTSAIGTHWALAPDRRVPEVEATNLRCRSTATTFEVSYTAKNNTDAAVTLTPAFAINGAVVAGLFDDITVPPHAVRLETAMAVAGALDYSPQADQCEVQLAQLR